MWTDNLAKPLTRTAHQSNIFGRQSFRSYPHRIIGIINASGNHKMSWFYPKRAFLHAYPTLPADHGLGMLPSIYPNEIVSKQHNDNYKRYQLEYGNKVHILDPSILLLKNSVSTHLSYLCST